MSRRRRLRCILLWGSNSSLWAGPQATRPRPIILAPPTQSHLPWDGAAWGLDLPSLLLPVPRPYPRLHPYHAPPPTPRACPLGGAPPVLSPPHSPISPPPSSGFFISLGFSADGLGLGVGSNSGLKLCLNS